MKFLNNLMIRAVIPFENHPEAQPDDQIKLTVKDIEYLKQTEQDRLLGNYKNGTFIQEKGYALCKRNRTFEFKKKQTPYKKDFK